MTTTTTDIDKQPQCQKYNDTVLPDNENNCSLCGSELNNAGECQYNKNNFDLEQIVNREVYALANTTGEMYHRWAIDGFPEDLGQTDPQIFNDWEDVPEDEDTQPKEILQYFIVSDWLGDKLKEAGKCVLETDDLTFYCREQCGIDFIDGKDFDFLNNPIK